MKSARPHLLCAALLLGLSRLAQGALDPAWSQSEYVFTGKLVTVQAGPVGMSMPPLYIHTLTFTVDTVLRGRLKVGDKVTFAHAARQNDEPRFPQGQVCLVAGRKGHDGPLAALVVKSEPALLTQVTAACALPLGWRVTEGKLLSPWAALGKGAWLPGASNLGATTVCSASGRPALLAGEGLALSVAPEPPKKSIQWTNPDGDGAYRLSLTNKTDQPLVVPALLTDGQEILWANSVVVLCQGKSYYLPGYRVAVTKLEPVTLAAGATVSGVVNPLALDGPEWPRGGYRIGFQFCLGELSASHDFYYMSRHHDPLRDALPKVKPGEILWDELKAVVKQCPVAVAGQTHARAVSVTLKDGRRFRALEPAIDDILNLVRETSKVPPPMFTE